jgi:serine/threonine-protein kinase OSR1/STK39
MKVLMMTLQNDPPTLDMCAEEKDQYKNYSKTFRKMIGECLKKDPTERPTAKQLLKHEFFKKAKDKAYIVKHLALPADARNMKVKSRILVPSIATSGRWSRRPDGEWGFDFDDDPKEGQNPEENAAALNAAAASGRLGAGGTSDDDDEEENNANNRTLHPNNVNLNNLPQQQQQDLNSKRKMSLNSTTITNASSTHLPNLNTNVNNNANSETVPVFQNSNVNSTNNNLNDNNINSSSSSLPPIHLVLRMRDEKKELQDIKFEFLPNKDTVDEISHELVNAKLIDAIDMIAVSANLNKLLENYSLSPITFPLVSKII